MRKRFPQLPALSSRVKVLLAIAGGIVGVFVVALIAVNLLISADWVRDRVAARIKEQTGRELKVNGTTALLFTPGPHVVITEATLTDPEARAGTADVAIGRLELDLAFSQLLSRQVDAERVVLVRPVLTLRLGKNTAPLQRSDAGEKRPHVIKAATDDDEPERDVRLKDVRIEDGTVDIVYDEKATERRIEHIDANVSLPTLTDPLTGTGKFVWKDQPVDFGIELTTLADLRAKRPARVVVSLDNPAIAARFEGDVMTKPSFSGHGELSAKVHSIPSLLAWMRERPPAATAIGDGELASKIVWTEQEITFSEARFALEHASGQGQAVVTLQAPRPHIRAALALDHLDLNPFLAGKGSSGKPAKYKEIGAGPAETAAPPKTDSDETASSSNAPAKKSGFVKPDAEENASADQAAPAESAEADQSAPKAEGAGPAALAAPVATAPAPAAHPAAFDADVNLNVRQTRIAHLELGPSSLGIGFRDGILTATLGGMELYDGHATGKIVFDAAKPVPTFTGDFRLDGVQAKTLLSDAAQFSMVSGKTKLALQLNGTGDSADEIKATLQGQGSLAVSDGAIEGIDLTEMISSIGEGQVPDMRQGPGAKTAFSDLGASFTIANGIIETNNLQMTSPLLKVAAEGKVDIAQSTIDILANPEIVAGEQGKGGANDLAGLTVPVRIEGPLDSPKIKPELKGMFASPEQANKTVKQIGEVIKKKFKGKPVGEAIGRLLGNVQIGTHGGDGGDAEAGGTPPAKQKQSAKPHQQGEPAPDADASGQGDNNDNAPDEPEDPDLQRILR
ncbi:MAG TPA: AsmA family protein [Methyloceanibacter sp.]|nr:AsmA family protein [Methyloceanibacter sp.]